MKINVFIFLWIMTISLFSCGKVSSLESDKNLTLQIEKQYQASIDTLNLTELSGFEWDKLLIFPPYSIIVETEKELNLNLTSIYENRIRESDDINLLVFLKDKKPVKIVELPRYADFENTQELIPKAKTKFIKSQNEKWIVLNN